MEHLIPGFLVRLSRPGHALGQESRAVPEQPEADGDDKAKEQDQEGPPGRPGNGAGRKKQGSSEGYEQTGDLCRQQVQVDRVPLSGHPQGVPDSYDEQIAGEVILYGHMVLSGGGDLYMSLMGSVAFKGLDVDPRYLLHR